MAAAREITRPGTGIVIVVVMGIVEGIVIVMGIVIIKGIVYQGYQRQDAQYLRNIAYFLSDSLNEDIWEKYFVDCYIND